MDLRPFADAGDESDGFVVGDGSGESDVHIIVGFGDGDFFVVNDGVGEFFAVATLDDDFVAVIKLVDVFKDAFDVRPAVVPVDDKDAALAWFAGLVVPTDVENVARGVEFASGVDTHREDAGIVDAEFFDGEVAGVVSGNGVFGALFLRDFGFINRLCFGDGFDGGARAALFFFIIIIFPDCGASEEESETEEDESEEDFAD